MDEIEIPKQRLIRTEQAAVIAGLSASTLNKMRVSGGGPRYHKLGRSVFYSQEDLEAWIDACRRNSTSVAA